MWVGVSFKTVQFPGRSRLAHKIFQACAGTGTVTPQCEKISLLRTQESSAQRIAGDDNRAPPPCPSQQSPQLFQRSTKGGGGWREGPSPPTSKMSANLHQKMVKSVNIFPLSVGAGRPKVFSFSTSLITVSCNTCGKDTLSPCRQRQQAEVDTLPDPPVWGQARSRS